MCQGEAEITKKSNIILLADCTDTLTMIKNVGPYKIACRLRKAGYEVHVIHHLHTFTYQELEYLLQSIVNNDTLMIGVNNFFYQGLNISVKQDDGVELSHKELGSFIPHGKYYNKKLRDLIAKINPNTKWVLGGPDATDSEYNKDFDYVVLGYGDDSIVNLANHLDHNEKLIKTFRSLNHFTVVNDARAENYNFTSDVMQYRIDDCILNHETLVIEISRGCIFRCKFCSYPLNGKQKFDYIKEKEILVHEFTDNFNKFGVTRYIFSDDTVNDSVEKCMLLQDIARSLPFKLEWWGYIRLDLLTRFPETISMLYNSGWRAGFFGIETLDSATSKRIGKGGDRNRLIDTLKKLKQDYGDTIGLHGSFIFGLPHESIDSMELTRKFLMSKDNPLDSWQANPMRIRSKRSNTSLSFDSGFISDIDLNSQNYGYNDITNQQTKDIQDLYKGIMIWQNEHTDWLSMVNYCDQLLEQGTEINARSTGNRRAFEIAGLGLPLAHTLNKNLGEVDWYEIDKIKLNRANQYKKLIWQKFNLTLLPVEPCTTFSDFLRYKYFKN